MTPKRKYLQRYPNGDIWFRYQGKAHGPLPRDESSKEFDDAYRALHARLVGNKAPKVGRPSNVMRPKRAAATIGWFVERWLGSVYFTTNSELKTAETFAHGTQHNYRLALNLLTAKGMTETPLVDLTPRNANIYIQKIKREHGGAAAQTQKSILSNLWKFARGFPEFDPGDRGNPLRDGNVDNPYTVKQEHMPWPEEVQEKFLAACDENLWLAFHLLLCTGQRIGDVAKMKWLQWDGTHFTLARGQQKDRSNERMTIKAPKKLVAILKGTERVHENVLTHKWNLPYTRDSLGHRIKDVLIEIGASEYTTHGLRKNAGIMLAEAGATVPQIMAALGHKTPKMALYYIRLANKKLLNDQAADILDMVFDKRDAAKVAAKRGQIRRVK